MSACTRINRVERVVVNEVAAELEETVSNLWYMS